ncbi:hypothetical protein [Stetteria hydrogenophila]
MSEYGKGGGFIVRCPRCKSVLYKYIIGDEGSKDKYIGPPSPQRVYARYDSRNTCPFCGARLGNMPKIKVLTVEQFRHAYRLVSYGGRELLVEKDLVAGDALAVPGSVHAWDEVNALDLE